MDFKIPVTISDSITVSDFIDEVIKRGKIDPSKFDEISLEYKGAELYSEDKLVDIGLQDNSELSLVLTNNNNPSFLPHQYLHLLIVLEKYENKKQKVDNESDIGVWKIVMARPPSTYYQGPSGDSCGDSYWSSTQTILKDVLMPVYELFKKANIQNSTSSAALSNFTSSQVEYNIQIVKHVQQYASIPLAQLKIMYNLE
eukprot:gene641-794_t